MKLVLKLRESYRMLPRSDFWETVIVSASTTKSVSMYVTQVCSFRMLIIFWLASNLLTQCGVATRKKNTVRVSEMHQNTLKSTKKSSMTVCLEKQLVSMFVCSTSVPW